MKSLDQKLERLRSDTISKDFILADARDADMAYGIASPGSPYPMQADKPFYSMDEFREQIREMVASEFLDIMLASVSTMSVLAHEENLFERSSVTPAIRANDTSDVWISRVSNYRDQPSRAFRTTYLKEATHGSLNADETQKPKVDLGLYSITFNNDLDCDHDTLERFREFRAEAAECNFRYFLEVFAPNVDCGLSPEDIPSFVNDSLVRCLAGVAKPHWPEFLKIPYFGPKAMEELAAYDSNLIVGILGGEAGTTYDAFKQLAEAKKYGARVALYGRKIKNAEHPLTFTTYLRSIADDQIQPEEAVKAYHADLEKLGIPAKKNVNDDLERTDPNLSYGK